MAGPADAKAAARRQVCDLLGSAPGHACFANELFDALRQRSLDRDLAETAVADLARSGEIIVRRNYCADPHLDGADLRTVARVTAADETAARDAAERLWNSWLSGYLSEHRCT
jgi:hypothetical protein